MNAPILLSSLAVGITLGYVLQRGRFCLNTALRNLFTIQDTVLVRVYIWALLVSLLGGQALDFAGALPAAAVPMGLAWPASAVGGGLFGVGMVLAGADVAGTWSKAGEGLVGSWMAALGCMLGASAAHTGAAAGITGALQGAALFPGASVAIHDLMGISRWVIVALAAAGCVWYLLSGPSANQAGQRGLTGRSTGVLIGGIIVLGLALSPSANGIGISFSAPASELLASITLSRDITMGGAVLIGVPLGALAGARQLREFSWRAPHAGVVMQQFSGGLLMGVGGMIAGGCSFGHGLTGLALLSLPSLVFVAALVLSGWSMIHLLFIRRDSSVAGGLR